MIFTWLCFAAAGLATLFGALAVMQAIYHFATPEVSSPTMSLEMQALLGGIVLGTLAEISFSVRKK